VEYIQKNINLAVYTSWLIGGRADFFCLPTTVEELKSCISWSQEQNLPITILGGGSNVLISDKGIRGLTICLKKMTGIEYTENQNSFDIICLSGTGKNELLKLFLKLKLPAALFVAGIPGDVGGGVVMNAGVSENISPREFNEIVSWIEILKPDLSIEKINSNQLKWSYRHCDGWQKGIIVKVGISVPNKQDTQVIERVREANKIRLSKQPLDMPSCGSVFINPKGFRAAQLIDECGLKGLQIGQAQVSKKHANFIVNLGEATANDTWSLIQKVQEQVELKKSVLLKTEVIRLGDWS